MWPACITLVYNLFEFFSSGAQPRDKAYFGQVNGTIWLDDLRCAGTETSIDFCIHKPWGDANCNHNEDVGVVCDTGRWK